MRNIKCILIFFVAITSIAIAHDCIPFVTVTQLLQNARDYHQKIIVAEGWTRRGAESFTIQATKEPFQREQIWLDDIDFIKATETVLHKKLRVTNEPELEREALHKHRELFSLKKPTHVVVKGEFQVLEESEHDYGAFKNHLIVYEVISIEK